jgi:hypothetical protein
MSEDDEGGYLSDPDSNWSGQGTDPDTDAEFEGYNSTSSEEPDSDEEHETFFKDSIETEENAVIKIAKKLKLNIAKDPFLLDALVVLLPGVISQIQTNRLGTIDIKVQGGNLNLLSKEVINKLSKSIIRLHYLPEHYEKSVVELTDEDKQIQEYYKFFGTLYKQDKQKLFSCVNFLETSEPEINKKAFDRVLNQLLVKHKGIPKITNPKEKCEMVQPVQRISYEDEFMKEVEEIVYRRTKWTKKDYDSSFEDINFILNSRFYEFNFKKTSPLKLVLFENVINVDGNLLIYPVNVSILRENYLSIQRITNDDIFTKDCLKKIFNDGRPRKEYIAMYYSLKRKLESKEIKNGDGDILSKITPPKSVKDTSKPPVPEEFFEWSPLDYNPPKIVPKKPVDFKVSKEIIIQMLLAYKRKINESNDIAVLELCDLARLKDKMYYVTKDGITKIVYSSNKVGEKVIPASDTKGFIDNCKSDDSLPLLLFAKLMGLKESDANVVDINNFINLNIFTTLPDITDYWGYNLIEKLYKSPLNELMFYSGQTLKTFDTYIQKKSKASGKVNESKNFSYYNPLSGEFSSKLVNNFYKYDIYKLNKKQSSDEPEMIIININEKNLRTGMFEPKETEYYIPGKQEYIKVILYSNEFNKPKDYFILVPPQYKITSVSFGKKRKCKKNIVKR